MTSDYLTYIYMDTFFNCRRGKVMVFTHCSYILRKVYPSIMHEEGECGCS